MLQKAENNNKQYGQPQTSNKIWQKKPQNHFVILLYKIHLKWFFTHLEKRGALYLCEIHLENRGALCPLILECKVLYYPGLSRLIQFPMFTKMTSVTTIKLMFDVWAQTKAMQIIYILNFPFMSIIQQHCNVSSWNFIFSLTILVLV